MSFARHGCVSFLLICGVFAPRATAQVPLQPAGPGYRPAPQQRQVYPPPRQSRPQARPPYRVAERTTPPAAA